MARLCFDTMNWSPFLGDFESDLPGQIRAAAAAGFPLIGIDLWTVDQYRSRGGTLDALRALLEQQGVGCFMVSALSIGEDEAECVALSRRVAELADALHPDYIHSGLTSAITPAAVANCRLAAELLHPTGARLAFEYLPFVPVDSIAASRELLRQVRLEGAGMVVDSWHFFHGPDDWAALESLRPEELAYIQFDDHPPRLSDDLFHETVQRRAFPGEGVLDLERFCSVLRARGFDGVVSLEVLSEELRKLDLGEFARRLHRAASRFWS
jgi:sugar phosphate isomerase/epimerase